MQLDIYCAQASLDVGEPLYGTAADETDSFILLEHSEPWGPKGLEDSGMDEAVVQRLAELTKAHPRARVQLLRRPDREPTEPACFLARTAEQELYVGRLPIARHRDLLDVDLEAWLRGDSLVALEPQERLLYLVCVHGKRDRCCAQRGMPVYRALEASAPGSVWMTTHLGGHRFAATVLVLPHGINYGRIAPDEAAALIDAHAQGRYHDLGRVRGRTCYSSAAQAADVFLRERLGLHDIDALRFLRSERDGELERVTFKTRAGEEHSLELAREALPPAPASCGAAPKAGKRFTLR